MVRRLIVPASKQGCDLRVREDVIWRIVIILSRSVACVQIVLRVNWLVYT